MLQQKEQKEREKERLKAKAENLANKAEKGITAVKKGPMRFRLFQVIAHTVEVYLKNRLSRSAAALSFFIMLSIFPFFICLNWLVGILHVDISSLLKGMGGFLPKETLNILNDYLSYVSGAESTPMLIAGMVFMATSSSAAFRIIIQTMEHIYHVRQPRTIWNFLLSFVCSFLFLFSIYICIILMLTGQWFLTMLENAFGFSLIPSAWLWLRFLLMFLFVFFLIYSIYRFTIPRKEKPVGILRGALFSAGALVVFSSLYSFFISLSARYALVYGSLASVMILMMWLYTCANIVMIGISLNIVLTKRKEERQKINCVKKK